MPVIILLSVIILLITNKDFLLSNLLKTKIKKNMIMLYNAW